MSFDPQNRQIFKLSAYDEILVREPEPRVQISALYGLLSGVETIVDTSSSGTATSEDSLFKASTGVAADGLSAIFSSRQVQARSGTGLVSRFQAGFTPGVADSIQFAGMQTSENSATFGFSGANFGINITQNGKNELQVLTVTTAAAGAEDATITIDGNPFTVPLTSGTESHNAQEIAASLGSQISTYLFSANFTAGVATVNAISVIAATQGAFAFTSATAVAAWVQSAAGASAKVTFVQQADWSEQDTVTTWLNPTFTNEYEVRIDGSALFSIYDPRPGQNKYVLVHVFAHANTDALPMFSNPTFRVAWIARNLGNTTNLTCFGGNASILKEGFASPALDLIGLSGVQVGVPSVNEVNLLSLRNRNEFRDVLNRIDSHINSFSLGTDANKSVVINLIKNPTFATDIDFAYFNKDDDILEFSDQQIEITGGDVIATYIITAGGGIFVPATGPGTEINPGDTLAFGGQVSSGSPAEVFISITGFSDL